jgi:colanic acid/amylovoran biosynthesis glycosyltransferase
MNWIPDFRTHLVIKSFHQNKIQGVLAEYGPTGVAMLEICQKMKLPLFVHFHGYDAVMQDTINFYGDAYQEMFQYASKIFSVSSVMTQKLIN